eukprot:IDg20761t1
MRVRGAGTIAANTRRDRCRRQREAARSRKFTVLRSGGQFAQLAADGSGHCNEGDAAGAGGRAAAAARAKREVIIFTARICARADGRVARRYMKSTSSTTPSSCPTRAKLKD